MLTLYGPDGEVAVPLLPKRALTLAQELLTAGVWRRSRRTGLARGYGAARERHNGGI